MKIQKIYFLGYKMTKSLVINVSEYDLGDGGAFADFLQKTFGVAVETRHTVYDAVALLNEKGSADLTQLKAIVVQDHLPIFHPYRLEEETQLHRELSAALSSTEQSVRGQATITYITQKFSLAGDTKCYLYTHMPEHIGELPENLSGVITSDQRFLIKKPSQVLAKALL